MRDRAILIQFLLNDSEAVKLNDQVAKSGLTRSAYLRSLIDGLIPQNSPPPDYRLMMNELRKIGANLNQIAQKANTLGVIDVLRYQDEVSNLRSAIARIDEAVWLPRHM